MKDLNSCTGLVERLFWLVKLRWIAVAGVLLTILLTSRVFRFVLPFFSLFLLAFFLIICNLVYIVLLKRYSSVCKRFDPHLPDVWSFGIINGIANIQISFDLLILMALIHFSGGIENPFLFYSIFHMTIA
ncbi:MAG: hypothetical protein KKF80_04505, partial [Candidatus Omnitrophica bacterium]|nr:hypothetical protein [Candidatus Omnitrophota bacterium]